jgi:hypothetical protein
MPLIFTVLTPVSHLIVVCTPGEPFRPNRGWGNEVPQTLQGDTVILLRRKKRWRRRSRIRLNVGYPLELSNTKVSSLAEITSDYGQGSDTPVT